MIKIISFISLIIGFACLCITSIIAYFKALGDDTVDKYDFVLGFYIHRYKKLFIIWIIGWIFVLTGGVLLFTFLKNL